MPVHHTTKAAYVFGAVAVLVLAGCGTEDDLRDVAEDTKLPIERVRDIMYPGLTVTLTTADDADMTVSYGTSEDVNVEDQTRTDTQVRIAAYGPRAANVVGLTDQTDLIFTMTDAVGIKR
jgi:alkaline phosphatase